MAHRQCGVGVGLFLHLILRSGGMEISACFARTCIGTSACIGLQGTMLPFLHLSDKPQSKHSLPVFASFSVNSLRLRPGSVIRHRNSIGSRVTTRCPVTSKRSMLRAPLLVVMADVLSRDPWDYATLMAQGWRVSRIPRGLHEPCLDLRSGKRARRHEVTMKLTDYGGV